MTTPASLIVERELPHPPEKVWRALTQSALLEQWLMKNDFQLALGHRFSFRAEPMPNWNGIIDCEITEIVPLEKLAYTWMAPAWTVTWTLSPTPAGTLLRMEQSGFRPDQDTAYKGATYGWRKFFGGLETVLSGQP